MIRFICGATLGFGIMSAFSIRAYNKGLLDGRWEQEVSNFLKRCERYKNDV